MVLDNACRSRIQRMSDLLTKFGLIDLVQHFQKCCQFWYLNTYTQVRVGTVLHFICNYILSTYWRCFELVGIRNVNNYMSNPFAIQ